MTPAPSARSARSIIPAATALTCAKEGSEEFLYLCDIHNRQVVKTSLKGAVVWKLGFPKEAVIDGKRAYQRVEQYRPSNVAFAPDGGFYVADGHGSDYVHLFDRDAKSTSAAGAVGAGWPVRWAEAERRLDRRSSRPR